MRITEILTPEEKGELEYILDRTVDRYLGMHMQQYADIVDALRRKILEAKTIALLERGVHDDS